MKLTFLGTGHGIGTAERACSATLIETRGVLYLIDGGVDLGVRIRQAGYDPTSVRAIFTTHAHSDHIGGLYQFIDLFNWARDFADKELDVFFTEVGIGRTMEDLVSMTTKPLDRKRIRIRTAGEGSVYSDENIKVTYFPTAHLAPLGRPSYGILIECEGKRIYFSGDLSQGLCAGDFPALPTMIPTELFVLELAHFGIEHIESYLPKVLAKKLAFNHVSPLPKYEEIEALKGKYRYEVLTPKDMDSIVI
jgi:Cft2 family RNA processing exonuclease